MGQSQISQVISALEYYRFNCQGDDDKEKDAEAAVTLREDRRIRAFESTSKHNEPKRAEKSLVLKAAGTSSGMCHLDWLLFPDLPNS